MKRSGNINVHRGSVSGAGSTTIVTTFADNGVPKAPTHVNTDVGQLFDGPFKLRVQVVDA